MLAFGSYVCGVLALRRVALDWRLTLGIAVGVQAFPLLGPVLLSTDVGVYTADGEMALDGANPYVESASNQVPSVYGPLFAFWSESIEVVAGGVSAAVFVHRLAAAAAVLLSAWLASRLVRNRGLALALVGWNPLVALHFGGGGHNDALMVVLALLAVTAASERRWLVSGVFWTSSAAVKLVAGGLVPIAGFAVLQREGARSAARFAVGVLAAAVAVATLASARYGTAWIDAVVELSDVGGRTGRSGSRTGWMTLGSLRQLEGAS